MRKPSAEKLNVLTLYKQGVSTTDIAKQLNVRYKTAWAWIDHYQKEGEPNLSTLEQPKPNMKEVEYEQVKASIKRMKGIIAALEQTVKEKDEALEKAHGEIKSLKQQPNDDARIARLEHEKAHLQATIELMNEQHEKKIQQAIESKSEVMNRIIEQREEIETLKKMLKRYL